MAEQPFSKFTSLFEQYEAMWKSIEIRALLALKDGRWVILKVMAYLRDTVPSHYGHEITFDGSNLRAVVEHRKIEALRDLMDSLRTGKLVVGDTEARMPTEGPYKEHSFGFSMAPSHTDAGPFPFFTIYMAQGSVSERVDENEINHLLYQYGYKGGLQEFSTAKTGEPVGGSYSVYFGIVATIYLVAYAESEPGYINARILCGEGVEPSDVSLAYDLYGRTEVNLVRRDKLVFTRQDRHAEEGTVYLAKRISAPAEVQSARLMVYYRNNTVPADSFNVLLGGVKATILTAFETLGKITGGGRHESLWNTLVQYLGSDSRASDSDRFEMAVCTLLTLTGLHTLHLGKAFGKGFDLPGIDLLVLGEQEREIVLVSCTIDNRLSQKTESLLSQLNSVRKAMPGWSIGGVIVAPIDRGDVTLGSFLDASEANISVVLRPEIRQILALVKSGSADVSAGVLEVLNRRPLRPFDSTHTADAYRSWVWATDRDVM